MTKLCGSIDLWSLFGLHSGLPWRWIVEPSIGKIPHSQIWAGTIQSCHTVTVLLQVPWYFKLTFHGAVLGHRSMVDLSRGHPQDGDGANKNFRAISTIMPNMNEIHQRVFKIWGLINVNAKILTLTFLWKFGPWPWPQDHPWGGDGADKNFSPISTIMLNMNEIHQRVSKIWDLINFNAKTLTLTFLWKLEVHDLDPKVTPGVGMVLIKTLDLYLPSCQMWMKSIEGSSKYEVL